MAVRVARVHPVELRREQGGLLSACAGADLEDHVAIVVRVAWQQQHPQIRQQARLEDFESLDLVTCHLPELVVGFGVAHFAGSAQLAPGFLELAVRGDNRFKPRKLAAESP